MFILIIRNHLTVLIDLTRGLRSICINMVFNHGKRKWFLVFYLWFVLNAYVLFAYKRFRQNMILSLNQQGEQGKKSAGSKKGRPKGSRNK